MNATSSYLETEGEFLLLSTSEQKNGCGREYIRVTMKENSSLGGIRYLGRDFNPEFFLMLTFLSTAEVS